MGPLFDTLYFNTRRHLETWLKHMEANGLDRTCDGLFPNLEAGAIVNRSQVLVTPANEQERSCPEYTFSGKIVDGLPEGKGTLKFR